MDEVGESVGCFVLGSSGVSKAEILVKKNNKEPGTKPSRRS